MQNFILVKDINTQFKVWEREGGEESDERCLFSSFQDKMGIYKLKFIRINALK